MAVTRGIVGFETGRVDTANMSLSGVAAVATNKPRTGTYNLRDQATASLLGQCNVPSGVSVASGDFFQVGFRFFFFVTAFPSVAPYVLGQLNINGFRLEMNTTGGLRLNTNLFSIAGTYTAAIQTGHWYEARMRFFGLNKTTAATNSARYLLNIEVYDWGASGTDDNITLVYSEQSPIGASVPSNAVCDNVSGKFDILSAGGSQTLATKVSGFHLSYGGSTPGGCGINANGDYDIFPAQTAARGPEGGTPCTSPCTSTGGHSIEVGSLNGLDVGLFTVADQPIPGDIQFNVGNSASGASSTRDIAYDDLYYSIESGVDTPLYFDLPFPFSTFVRPFPIIAQGFYDLFTPSGSFNLINAIPMVDTGTITASVIDRATSYLHDPISLDQFAEHIRAYARVNGANLTQQLILFIDPSILAKFNITVPTSTGNVFIDDPLEFDAFLSADDFNTLEYGAIVLNTGTFNVHSLFIEVLTGEADLVLFDGTNTTGENIEGGLNIGDLGLINQYVILITDGSGIYQLTPNQFFDTLYTRNVATDDTLDVQIPDPFADTTFFGDDSGG